MERPYQTSYVPELPPTMDASNKENPFSALSKPKFKSLSSKSMAVPPQPLLQQQQQQQSQAPTQAPRLILGNISTNVAANTAGGKPTFGKPQQSGRTLQPLAFKPTNIANGSSRSGVVPFKDDSKLSMNTASSSTSEKLSKLIEETNARNSITEMEKRQFMANSSTIYKKKSLLGSSGQTSELLAKSSGRQDIYKTLSLNPAKLRGTNIGLAPSATFQPRPAATTAQPLVFGASRVFSTLDSQSMNVSRSEDQPSFVKMSNQVADKPQATEFDVSGISVASSKAEISQEQANSSELPIVDNVALEVQEQQIREEEAESARQEQLDAEERARAERRKQQKEEEMNRRGTDLVNRARAKEQNGDTAAALALFKEALVYFPDNDKLKLRVDNLRSQLRGMTMPALASEQSDDPLEALFGAASSNPEFLPSTEADLDRARSTSPTTTIVPTESLQTKLSVTDSILNMLSAKAASATGSKQKFMGLTLQIVQSMLEIEEFQKQTVKQQCDGSAASTNKKKKFVQFHSMDCAIDPPPTQPTEDDFESSLYPIDRVIESLSRAVKAGDDARKLAGGNSAKTMEQSRAWIAEVTEILLGSEHGLKHFLACSVAFTAGRTSCTCIIADQQQSRCVHSAIPLKERLGQILSMALRFCMRRAFNQQKWMLQPGSGSYRYAYEDVASVTHQALLLFDTRLHTVDSIVLLGKSSNKAASSDQVARVGEFVEAHRFLSELFSTEEKCLEMQDSDSACWAKIRKYLTLAREHKCEDELVLSPLADLTQLVRKLKEQTNLVLAARSHVDLAFRRAMKEDTCGQCTCEGARRRRAYALGTWIAPTLVSCSSVVMARCCGKCNKSMLEKEEQISCECCQKPFHLKCVGLPTGYESDFVCSKCVPKFKQAASEKQEEEEEE